MEDYEAEWNPLVVAYIAFVISYFNHFQLVSIKKKSPMN